MKNVGEAFRGALAAIPPSPGQHGQARALMPAERATEVLVRPPSAELAAALAHEEAASAGPLSYVAVNGEKASITLTPRRISAETAVEAGERLASVNAALAARPEPGDLLKWLLGFSGLVERAPEGEALMRAIRVLAQNLDAPAIIFTPETGTALACELVFWPSFAKLQPALLRQAEGLRREQRHLSRILMAAQARREAMARPQDRPLSRATPAPAELAAVRAKAQALAAEVAARTADPERKPRKPGHLDDAGLVPGLQERALLGGPLGEVAQRRLAAITARLRQRETIVSPAVSPVSTPELT